MDRASHESICIIIRLYPKKDTWKSSIKRDWELFTLLVFKDVILIEI